MKQPNFVYCHILFMMVVVMPAHAAVKYDDHIELQRPYYYAPINDHNTSLKKPVASSYKCGQDHEIANLLKKYDHAIKRYVDSKTRSILRNNTPRIKDGMTLSHYFPDYWDYQVFIRRQTLEEIHVTDGTIRTDYFIWKEGDKIIMGSDVMLMAEHTQNLLIEKVTKKARSKWAADEYRQVAEKTKRVGNTTAFRLDCQHSAELNELVKKVIGDLMAQKDTRVISPRTFDKLLTILRAYITFNYYKDLSHQDFEERYKKLGQTEGRGKWSHQKLTRLLGLHVMGRIESNRAFRKTYFEAISKAAKMTPTIPRSWIEEIIWIETKGDPMTISRAGAYGLMQLMPLVYIGMGAEKSRQVPLSFVQTINPFNADRNIERGAIFLDKLRLMLKPHMRNYAKETQKKIIFHAYNCGVTRVISLLKKHGLGYKSHLPNETKSYLDKLADFPGPLSQNNRR